MPCLNLRIEGRSSPAQSATLSPENGIKSDINALKLKSPLSPFCIPGLGTSGILKEESCEADLGMLAPVAEEGPFVDVAAAVARSSSLNLNSWFGT